MVLLCYYIPCIALASFASAGFPATPKDITTKQVSKHPGLSLSYKRTSICETTAKAWSGYVHMPATYLADIETSEPYNASVFFWYFEARNAPEHAPTVIYLAGGAGQSSMYGAAEDGGPCYVLPDSNSTVENPWSWNVNANILYLDQPVGVGFSYDKIIKSTQDQLYVSGPGTGIVPFDDYKGAVPAENTTFLYGMYPSQDPQKTANTSAIAAQTSWHFMQVWFTEFPEWKTSDKKVSFWGNSYGGIWVPTTAAHLQRQNVKIADGQLEGTIVEVDTIGYTNGCTDMLYQGEFYPQSAYNNTYDLQVVPKHVYEQMSGDWPKCSKLIAECRKLGDEYDPSFLATNATVNKYCESAFEYCYEKVIGPYEIYGNRSAFDMAQVLPMSVPNSYITGYFQQQWVQQELGVPVNWTGVSTIVSDNYFGLSGDILRTAGLKDLEYLLSQNVKVALVFGDRDYRCPWLGGEDLSLKAKWTGSDQFRSAGYEYIKTNGTYDGGMVRQHGNLSFSRVFEAGHDAQYFQPETVFRIFNRAMFNRDVATGKLPNSGASNGYTTTGPPSSFGVKNIMPPSPPSECYLYSVSTTCTWDQYYALGNGTATIEDFSVVKPEPRGGPVVNGGVTS